MSAETVVPSPVVTPGESAPDAPTTSALGSLIGIFTEPKKTFASMVAKPRILAPLLFVVVFQIVAGVVLMESGVIRNDAIAKMEAKNTPQESIDAFERIMSSPARFFFVGLGPVAFVFILLLTAGLLYFMANLMLGARLRYAHYLCIACYGSVVATVDYLVRMGLALSRGTMNVHLGAGAFMGDPLSFPLRILDTLTDPLFLWAVLIQALGVAVMSKKGFATGLLAVIPSVLILVLLTATQH